MKKNKIFLIASCILLAAAMVFSGTVAYLTDDDEDVNVMVVGDVSIEQIEQERDENGDLVEFSQAKPAIPAVYNDGLGTTEWADEGVVVNGTEYKVFDETMKNVNDKIVTVKNTGKNAAYIRTLVAIEAPTAKFDSLVHINYNDTDTELKQLVDAAGAPVLVEIDGVNYAILSFVYDEALAAGETSAPSLVQTFIDPKATKEDLAPLGQLWEIKVLSQAVQAEGFSNPAAALTAAFGEVTAENAEAWFTGMKAPAAVTTADELIEALENGEDVLLLNDVKIDPAGMSNAYGTTGINVKNGQTIDGAGATLDIKGAGGTWDSGINTTGGLIKNITVTGSFRGIFINHNSSHSEPVVLENVIIDGTTYTISCDQGMNQNFEAYNSTFNGWTSYAATLGNAKFENCSFGEGNGYAFCRPYAPTTFVGCDFEAGYVVDPRAAVTFEDCTVGGVALTDANLDTLVTDAANVTVK